MVPELHTLLNDWKCCICEEGMHRGTKAVVITKGRSMLPKYALHPECVEIMKDMIDKDDEEEQTDGAA